MSFLLHQPRESLRPLVQSIWSADLDVADALIPGLIAPDAHVEFVFHLHAPCTMQRAGSSVWELLPQAMLYAQRSACVRLRSTNLGCMIAFRTSAIVASVILRRPIHDLWDQPVALQDVLGTSIDALTDQLDAAEPMGRFAIVEDWLRMRLTAWSAQQAQLELLHAQLVWHSNGAPIERTAAALGTSLRSLRRWIGESAGISPKQLELSGRILRSCALLQERPDLSITDIAQQMGFSDHAAFANAFREQTAMTPRAFRSEPLAFYERGPS
jgi:AraC-like DNA-binding protein